MVNNIILASTSPRRSEILKEYDVDFEVDSSKRRYCKWNCSKKSRSCISR